MLHSNVAQALISPLVDDRVPAEDYVSEEFLLLENQRVWPKVWHVACREEDLPEAGSYYVYDYLNESVLLVRLKDGAIKAFHNVCKHRGRQLMDGCGHAVTLRCRFHGWRWNIDGTIAEVLDREGWGQGLTDESLHLNEVHTGVWGGFVFINTADQPEETLDDYLKPVPELFGHFEFEKMRYEKWRTYELDCNWKVAIEAFNEAYHVAGTHTQLLRHFDDRTATTVHGKHAVVRAPETDGGIRPLGRRSNRMTSSEPVDARRIIIDLYNTMAVDIGGTYQARDAEVAHRLLTELLADASPAEVQAKFIQFRKEASEAVGAGWPDVTPEQLQKGGLIWHVFPNLVLNTTFNASYVYRARPHVTDPNRCELDVIFLRRYAPGAEPVVPRVRVPDWQAVKDDVGLIICQDFGNLGFVQKGMRSSGFEGARPNMAQEATVLNFHRVLRDYMGA